MTQSSWLSFALAAPTESAFTEVPSRFRTLELTGASRALGEVCYSFEALPDGSVCDPSALPSLQEGSLLGRLYFGNGYAALSTANQLLYDSVSKEFLQNLFRNQSVTSLEVHAGLLFTGPGLAASFSPYRVQYFSEVHNPNFPVVALHAALERSFSFAYGTQIGDFRVGSRLRLLERKFVHTTFSLFQAGTDNAGSLVPIQSQRAVFLDPSVSYLAQTLPLAPRLTLALQNLGYLSNRSELYDDRVDFSAGIGVEPAIGIGTLHLGMDLANLIHAPTLGDRVRFGAAYTYGMLTPMVGWNSDAATLGMQFRFQWFQAGVTYEFSRRELTDANLQNRIATEFALRL